MILAIDTVLPDPATIEQYLKLIVTYRMWSAAILTAIFVLLLVHVWKKKKEK